MAASTRLLHLARLVHGTHRRFCCACRHRWTAPDKAFLPWARRAGVFFACVTVALALACVIHEVWLAPRPCPLQTEAWADALDSGAENFPGGALAAAYGQGLVSPGLLGMRFTDQDYALMRARAGQSPRQSDFYRLGMRGVLRQYEGSHDMSALLRRAAAVLKPMGKKPGQFASEVESSDKQVLWNKYGSNFSSKEEARSAYEEFKRRRSEIPADWPPDPVK